MLRSTERSRGTGPRATITGHFLHKTAPFPVGRGPVPRHAAIYRTIAGDRPPRYDNGTVSLLAGDRPPRYGNRTFSSQNGPFHRRARACPSPCCGLSKTSFRSVGLNASRPGGLSYRDASRPGGLSYQEGSVVARPQRGINTETDL